MSRYFYILNTCFNYLVSEFPFLIVFNRVKPKYFTKCRCLCIRDLFYNPFQFLQNHCLSLKIKNLKLFRNLMTKQYPLCLILSSFETLITYFQFIGKTCFNFLIYSDSQSIDIFTIRSVKKNSIKNVFKIKITNYIVLNVQQTEKWFFIIYKLEKDFSLE